jgi:hypothetical protein
MTGFLLAIMKDEGWCAKKVLYLYTQLTYCHMASSNSRAIQEQVAASVCLRIFEKLGVELPENPHPSNLIGVEINRDKLTGHEIFESMADILSELRGIFSASGMRCLRSTSATTEKNPMINALRQICKINGLQLSPKSKSDGYEASGQKKMRRWFVVESLSGE